MVPAPFDSVGKGLRAKMALRWNDDRENLEFKTNELSVGEATARAAK